MVILISPAKTMDFQSPIPYKYKIYKPLFQQNADYLITLLKNYDEKLIQNIMSISDKLLPQVSDTIHRYTGNFNLGRQAIYAYQGAVFKAINSTGFDKKQISFAQDHLRILSGLYGVLKPLDGIEEYRLDMKIKLKPDNLSNMYAYWKESLTNYFIKNQSSVIINLASNEYSRIVDFSKISTPVINISFGELSKNKIKYPPMYSKMARGEMVGFIIRNFISTPEELKMFSINKYSYNLKLSTNTNYIFTR